MRKFIYGFTIALLVIAAIAAIVLGGIAFTQYQRADDQAVTIEQLRTQVTSLSDQVTDLSSPEMIKFSDKGIGIEVTHPADWIVTANTHLDTSSEVLVTDYITQYELTLTNQSTALNFSTLFGGIGFLPIGVSSEEYDKSELNDSIIRISKKGSGNWDYVTENDCAEIRRDLGATEISADADICYVPIGPGIGGRGYFVQLSGATAATAEIADAIVLSAIK